MKNLNEHPDEQNINTNHEQDDIMTNERATQSLGRPQGQVLPFERRQVENESHERILSVEESQDLGSRWTNIQADFVDEPRRAVEAADNLVASAIQRISETFTDERSRLESQWSHGDEVSTEDLRLALQRYRRFFGRLLSM